MGPVDVIFALAFAVPPVAVIKLCESPPFPPTAVTSAVSFDGPLTFQVMG